MNRALTSPICLLSGIALSACANVVSVSYVCDPPGAQLYEEYSKPARNLGTCPTTVTYDVPDEKKAQGFILVRGVTAVWASGASQASPSSKVDLQDGYATNVEIKRPGDVPGYEDDVRYGRDLETGQMLDQQLRHMNNGGR